MACAMMGVLVILAMIGVVVLAVGVSTIFIVFFAMVGPKPSHDEEVRQWAREYYRL